MSNQTKFNDSILDEVIPIYLDSISTKERLENDILRLQGEVEELETISENFDNEEFELHQTISDKESKLNKTELSADILLNFIIGFSVNVILFVFIFNISILYPLGGSIIAAILRFKRTKSGKREIDDLSSFLYKHSKRYRKLKDSLEKDMKKYSELRKKMSDIDDDHWQKQDEIDNKRRELEKLSVAVESMERKFGRKLILERAVRFGVPSEILDIMQNIDDILEPNQESLEEGKGQFTLTTPTTI